MVDRVQNAITGDGNPEGSDGSDERSLRRSNIAAGQAVGELVRTTLGPQGMDKLLVDDNGMGIVTNNGASILREMVEHPVGNLISDLSVSHEDEVRDGTTTTAVLTGELLGGANELLDQGIHPTTIISGYNLALNRALDVLAEIAVDIDSDDTGRLVDIAGTSLAGKGTFTPEAGIAELVVEAVQRIADEDGDVDLDRLQIEKITGQRVSESTLLNGVIIGKERSDASSVYRVEDATIAVVDRDIEVRELSSKFVIDGSEYAGAGGILDTKREKAHALVDHLVDIGVDAVIAGENIEELVRRFMIERGIYTARRVHDDEVKILAEATGASIAADASQLTEDDLGHARLVEESDIGGELKTLVETEGPTTTASMVLYGSTRNIVDELHRSVNDALEVVALAIRESSVLPGGGATEAATAHELRDFSAEHGTREQLAIEAFADALEMIPRTLAENAGINPIDGVVNVRAAQSSGTYAAGIDGETGEVIDTLEAGILDPYRVKADAFKTAVDVAEAILRIDGMLPRRDQFDAENVPESMAEPGQS